MKTNYLIVLALSMAMLFFASCNRDEATTKLNVHLTDAPADYDAVFIDVIDVQIHASDQDNEGSWESLDVNTGIFNLLDFNNGMDTLLASAELPVGNISQMRLVLGSNNSVVIDGESFNLETPSAQQSGLKFNIHAELTEGIVYNLWVDFDAGRSIVATGSGKYSLKPVIRTFNEAVSGAIKGMISPASLQPHVMAIIGTDTIGTIASETGYFLIKGAKEGNYSVLITPNDTLIAEKTIENVNVTNGNVTDMGDIVFE